MSNLTKWFEYSDMARDALQRVVAEPVGSPLLREYETTYDEIAQFRDEARSAYETEMKLTWGGEEYQTVGELTRIRKYDPTYTVRRGPGRPRKG